MNSTKNQKTEFHLYKKRWFMLCIFISFTFMNSLQWGEYVIISNLVAKFYQVPTKDVDWTSVVYMVAYIPLIFPALWLLDKTVSFTHLQDLKNNRLWPLKFQLDGKNVRYSKKYVSNRRSFTTRILWTVIPSISIKKYQIPLDF